MTPQVVSPKMTLAILLGASQWPNSPQLGSGASFANSAQEISSYLLDKEDGFGLPKENLLNLFDSTKSPADLDLEVSKFLEERIGRMKESESLPHDLLVFYIGHGGFFGPNQEYYMAIRSTRKGGEGASSYRMVDLAKTLNEGARHLRRYLILDCCFAASAYAEFQSAPIQAACKKTLEYFPSKGTALLCSSGSRDPSLAPRNEPYTMFSAGLLQVLRHGNPNVDTALSLEEVSHKITELIREKYPDEGVRPEVHSPDQSKGDISDIPLFPNAALRSRSMISRLNTLEGRLDQVETKILDIQSILKAFEKETASLKKDRESTNLLLSPGSSASGPSAEILSQRGKGEHFFLPGEVWQEIPPELRIELMSWRQAKRNGCGWILIPLLLFVVLIFYYKVSYNLGISDHMILVILALLAILGSLIGIKKLFISAKSTSSAELQLPQKTSWWENLDPVISMRATRFHHLWHSVLIASPYFEIGGFIYILDWLYAAALLLMNTRIGGS